MRQNDSDVPLQKVLIVDLSLGYGGSTSRVLSLLERSIPGSIGLACLRGGSVTRHALSQGVPVHIVGNRKIDPSISFNLIKLIREENYQLLDCQNIQSKFWGNLAALATGASLVSTMHSWYLDEHGRDTLKGWLYSGLEMFTNPRLDLYITVSGYGRQALLDSGIREENIELIYNAVEIDPSAVRSNPENLRERFGFPIESMVCTAVGRLVAAKNYRVLVDAIQKAIAEVPRLDCLIIGTGELENELKSQIHHLGLQKHVLLAGYREREEVLEIIKSSDVFVMPSKSEGSPIALLEAAALGTPILATRAGGIPELLTDHEHALLVDWEDADAMARGLVKLCQDRIFANALGNSAQRHVRVTFNLERQLQSTWQAYQKAWQMHKKHRGKYRTG